MKSISLYYYLFHVSTTRKSSLSHCRNRTHRDVYNIAANRLVSIQYNPKPAILISMFYGISLSQFQHAFAVSISYWLCYDATEIVNKSINRG